LTRIAVFSALILLATTAALADPLARVEGVEREDLRERLIAAIGEAPAKPETRLDARRHLQSATSRAEAVLRSEGFYAADIDGRLAESGPPVLLIDAGPRFLIGDITVQAAPDADAAETARDSLGLESGEALRAEPIIQAEARGLAALRSNGWPDARAEPREVVVDHASGAGAITFRYDTGAYATYGPVQPEDGPWRPGYITRLSPLEPGAAASLSELRGYQRRLETLDSVDVAVVSLGEASGDEPARPVEVTLEPAPRHAVEAAVSYSTGEGAEGVWTRRNMFGGDESLSLSAEAATLAQGVGAELALPHWRRVGQSLTLAAGARSEDTDAFQQSELTLSADLSRRMDQALTLGLGTSLDASRVTDSNGEEDFISLGIRTSALYDTRSDPLDPRGGVRAEAVAEPVQTFGSTGGTYVKLSASASSYYAMSDRITWAGRIHLGSILGGDADNVPADQRFFAGGGGSARGYEYQSLGPRGPDGAPVGGFSLAEASLELRARLMGRWGGVAFIDAASVGDSASPEFGDLRAAAGLGVRYHLDFAPIRFDVGVPLDKRDGDDAFQIYISIGQAF